MTTALLIIDVRRGPLDDEPRPHEADAVVERINALARRARENASPVIFIQHERASGNLAYQSQSWQLERNLETGPSDLFVRKSTPDSFLRTDLQEILARCQVALGHLRLRLRVLRRHTTRRAVALGFSVTLAADAHTTHDKEHASAAAIRAHENVTLLSLSSFGVPIQALPSARVAFAANLPS